MRSQYHLVSDVLEVSVTVHLDLAEWFGQQLEDVFITVVLLILGHADPGHPHHPLLLPPQLLTAALAPTLPLTQHLGLEMMS